MPVPVPLPVRVRVCVRLTYTTIVIFTAERCPVQAAHAAACVLICT